MKKSFVLYHDFEATLNELSDEQAGKLLRATFAYSARGEIVDYGEVAVKLTMPAVRAQIDRDNEKYDKVCERNRKNGQLGGMKTETQSNPVGASGVQSNPVGADSDSLSDSESLSDNQEQENINTSPPIGVIVSEGKREGKRFTPPTVSEVSEYVLSRKSTVDPDAFVAFYESKGWMIGKNRVKDWKACVRTWEANDKKRGVTKPAIDTSWHVYRDWSTRYLTRRRAIHPDDTPEPTQDVVDAGAQWLGEWICPDGFSEPQIKAGIVWLLENPRRCQHVKHLGDLGLYSQGVGGNLGTWCVNGAMGMPMPADPFNPGPMDGGPPRDIA